MAWENQELVSVTIRLEKSVVADLKREAATDMIFKGRYQKLARNILTAWSNGSPMPARYIPDPKKKKEQKKTRR